MGVVLSLRRRIAESPEPGARSPEPGARSPEPGANFKICAVQQRDFLQVAA